MKTFNLNLVPMHLLCALILALLVPSISLGQPQPVLVGDVAPDFTVTDINGTQHNLYDYLDDGKYVLLKFGFMGCPSCETSRPSFNNVYRNFGCNTEDIILLEFDVTFTDADILPSTWVSSGLADQAGTFPATDIDYVFPEAPYITTDGGSAAVSNSFGVSAYTSEFIIEPDNKTVLGRSATGTGPATAWSNAFSNEVIAGLNPTTMTCGLATTATIESQIEAQGNTVFHYVSADNMADWITDFPALYSVPLNGSQPGATPFAVFCSSSFTGCDTITPSILSHTVTPENDSTHTLTVDWSGTGGCQNFVIEYGVYGGGLTQTTTSSTSIDLTGLYPGKYFFRVKCACNTTYQYDTGFFVIESNTDFTQLAGCTEVCSYKLLVHGFNETNATGFTSPWVDERVRVESGGMFEVFTYHDQVQTVVNGVPMNAMIYDLSLCKGSDVNISFVDPGTQVTDINGNTTLQASFYGFKLYDSDDNLLLDFTESSLMNPVLIDPATHSGIWVYPPIEVDCDQFVGISEKNSIAPSIYPVPFRDHLTIEFDTEQMPSIEAIEVVDVLGKKVPFIIAQTSSTVNLTLQQDSPAGVYFVTVITQNGRHTLRAVKE